MCTCNPREGYGGPSWLISRANPTLSSVYETFIIYHSGIHIASNNDLTTGVPTVVLKGVHRPTVLNFGLA